MNCCQHKFTAVYVLYAYKHVSVNKIVETFPKAAVKWESPLQQPFRLQFYKKLIVKYMLKVTALYSTTDFLMKFS